MPRTSGNGRNGGRIRAHQRDTNDATATLGADLPMLSNFHRSSYSLEATCKDVSSRLCNPGSDCTYFLCTYFLCTYFLYASTSTNEYGVTLESKIPHRLSVCNYAWRLLWRQTMFLFTVEGMANTFNPNPNFSFFFSKSSYHISLK